MEINLENDIEKDEIIEIYKANNWSSAEKPELLISALRNSDSIVTARISGKLVGIGNTLSDGYLAVYYPHVLVHPEHHGAINSTARPYTETQLTEINLLPQKQGRRSVAFIRIYRHHKLFRSI